MSGKNPGAGRLYVVATPIGNLEDVTLRALRVLSEVSLIAAEDTRHTRKLLSAHGIATPLISYREQNHGKACFRVIERLAGGESVALVSDAGTPGISDPGRSLVDTVLDRGFQVQPVPGPSAVVAALSAAGLPSDRFLFIGFLPRKAGALKRTLQGLCSEPGSLVFYESPRRLPRTLEQMAAVLGPRPAVVVRELSKLHEQFDRGRLDELARRHREGVRGEVTLVVGGTPKSGKDQATGEIDLPAVIRALHAGRRLTAGEIARLLGLRRGPVYRQLLDEKTESQE